MKKTVITLVLLHGIIESVIGQRLADMTNYPASPQTAALFKALAAPVSYYTGQPDVSIPIYTISQDGVELPITLSFNTSGIFVTEEATSVGLGVRLNWGGSIIRSANGRPDELGFFSEPYEISNLKTELPKDYSAYTPYPAALCYPYCNNNANLMECERRARFYHCVNSYNDPYKDGSGDFNTDLRPDDFHYDVLGKSGLFRFNQADGKFITFPLDDIKIDKSATTAGIQKFEITRSDGVKITLGDGATEHFQRVVSKNFDQTWFVSKITTVKNTTIDFEYIDNRYSVEGEFTEELRVPFPSGGYNATSGGEGYFMNEKLIRFITFKAGKLEFVYVRDRTDIGDNDGVLAPRLSRIILYDKQSRVVKTFSFYQSYFVGTPFSSSTNYSKYNNRLRLDAFSVNDNASKSIEKYLFEYNTAATLPSKKSLARDHWGYYNGADGNRSLIPSSLISLPQGFKPYDYNWGIYNDRYINSSVNKVFTIKKIKFPTGGEREFAFENNEVAWYQLFSNMKNISNDGYDIFQQQMTIRGASLSDYFPTPSETNGNGTQRTFYSDEFTIQDYNDLVIGEPSLTIETTFINPNITHSQLNLWAYNIQIGIQNKSGTVFNDYSIFTTYDIDNYSGSTWKTKLPALPDGTYRIIIKMTVPPKYVMDNWKDQNGNTLVYGHNTIVKLRYRKKNFGNIKVGGFRVKEIIDRESANEYKTTYDYTKEGGYCSGQINDIPEYKEYIVTTQTSLASPGYTSYAGYRILSEAVRPITKTQGSNVGYTNVVKRQINTTTSEEIKEEFIYSFVPSLQVGCLKEYYKDSEPRAWQSGKLLGNKRFLNGTPVSEDIYDYYGLNNETDKGFVEEINTSLITGYLYGERAGFTDDKWDIAKDWREENSSMQVWEGMSNLHTTLYYFDNVSAVINGNSNGNISANPPAKIPYFKQYTGFDKLKSKTTKNYFGSSVVTEVVNYYYDGLPGNLQLSRTEHINSKGQNLISKFFYPQNLIADPFMTEMVGANRVGAPVKTEMYVNTTKLSEEKFIYSKDTSTNNLLLPKFVYSATFPNTNPNVTNPPVGQLERKVTYDFFDAQGNLTQYHQESNVLNSVIWGYNGVYPVAKIEGVSYTQVKATIDQAVLDNPADDATLRLELNKIRTAFHSAPVTTYTYKPLVGISSVTDPNGVTTYYEYDNSSRLSLIRDDDNNILKKYCYNYAGQVQDCGQPVNYTVTYNNTINLASCKLTYTNVNTGVSTVINPVSTGSGNLVSLPPGIYNVQCTFPTAPAGTTYQFDFGCKLLSTDRTFTIDKLSVSSTSCNSFTITNGD